MISLFGNKTAPNCFLSSFVKLHSVVAEEKTKMYQSTKDQDGHLGFPIAEKLNLAEDVEFLLPVKFSQRSYHE